MFYLSVLLMFLRIVRQFLLLLPDSLAVITISFALTGSPGLEVLPCVAGDFLWVPELVDPPPSVLVGFFTNTFQVDGPVPVF